jgi:hypothetical protein
LRSAIEKVKERKRVNAKAAKAAAKADVEDEKAEAARLQPVIKREVRPSVLAKVRLVAMDKMYGNSEEEITKLSGIAAALEGKGHLVKIECWDHDDLLENYLQRLIIDHNIGHKKRPLPNRIN